MMMTKQNQQQLPPLSPPNSAHKPIHDIDIRLESVVSNRTSKPQTPTTTALTKQQRLNKRGNKKTSNFENTFSKLKTIDPFASENKRHAENMEKGFLELLQLHDTMELSSLCGMLQIKVDRSTKNLEKVDLISRHIRDLISSGKQMDLTYISILKLMWEGTLYEYLRIKGQPLNSTSLDPRGFIISYWRKLTKQLVPFDPYYVQTTLQNRSKDDKRADDINQILDSMESKELAVKQYEFKIRREHDYTNILSYLQSVSSLHTTEREGRNFLINAVESCRAKVVHTNASINILNDQLSCMEYRHEVVKGEYLEKLSVAESTSSGYFEMLCKSQGEEQVLNSVLRRQILDVREDGGGGGGEENEEGAETARKKCEEYSCLNSYERITKINNSEALLKRLGKQNNLERNALKLELSESQNNAIKLAAQLERTSTKLKEETARADEAEDKLYDLQLQGDSFKDIIASREALIEVESNSYFSMAAHSIHQDSVLSHKVNSVLPLLLSMTQSNDPAIVTNAALIIQCLGVMSADEVMCLLENNAMGKEEVGTRELEAVSRIKGLTVLRPKSSGILNGVGGGGGGRTKSPPKKLGVKKKEGFDAAKDGKSASKAKGAGEKKIERKRAATTVVKKKKV